MMMGTPRLVKFKDSFGRRHFLSAGYIWAVSQLLEDGAKEPSVHWCVFLATGGVLSVDRTNAMRIVRQLDAMARVDGEEWKGGQ